MSASDASAPGSFPATGERDASARRIAVVTGASAGIGLYTALGLARAGMRVTMIGRDPARTEAARRFVSERVPGAQIETGLADFASLAEIRRLAGEILAGHDRIDVLVNNAGLFSPKFERSRDGYEMTFAVNHLAPFLLTNLLLDRLKASAPSRIVNVASRAHYGARIDLATIAGPRDWSMLKAYNRSKLANILFTRELAARLQGTGVVATSLHPGVVATTLAQRGGIVGLVWRLAKPLMISPEQGAETSVFLATVPDPAPFAGGYVVRKTLARPDPVALDADLARRLWEESARLVGL
ncbi:MAG TPA: SDR family oxidoreductase [Stellaceae bacterium]|nr:SDR family oxidoreductase [Stellaceae bacterium]